MQPVPISDAGSVGPLTREDAELQDARDPLGLARMRFDLPAGVIYLDGNSLGALPTGVMPAIQEAVQKHWGQGLIRSWNDADWINAPVRIGARIAALIGAADDEVIAADSTSVNLFKALNSALRLGPQRGIILGEAGDFPTNHYIAASVAAQNRREFGVVDSDTVLNAIDERVAVVSLSHVNYRTGRRHDLARITRRAHEVGALVVWDLCHSAGAMPCALADHQVDFAVGCGYKYLNGGPGAPAFIFAARRHHAGMTQPLTGWFGHEAPFEFASTYAPAPDMRRMLAGTPAIVALQALEAALEAFDGIDMQALRDKSVALTDQFMALVDQELAGFGFQCLTPRVASQRGSQVSITSAQAYPIMQALIDRGVIGDVRTPDILRFGFAPLYTRFVDVWDAVAVLKDIMQQQAYLEPRYQQRKTVI